VTLAAPLPLQSLPLQSLPLQAVQSLCNRQCSSRAVPVQQAVQSLPLQAVRQYLPQLRCIASLG